MALQKTQIGFPFIKGINQKPSEKSQAAGELTDAKNFRMDKTGRLDRRLGFDRFPKATVTVGETTAGTIDGAKAMAHLGDEILLFDGEEVFSKTSDDKWVKRANALNVRSDSRYINRDIQSTSGNLAYAISGNYEYAAWAEQPYDTGGDGTELVNPFPGNLPRYRYLVRDRHTGATIVPTGELPSFSVMDTRVTFDGTISSAQAGTITTSDGAQRVEVGNYVFLSSDEGDETQKHLVSAVGATTISVTPHLSVHHQTNISMTVYKDTGSDSLFWAPRLRLIAIPGTSHVYLLTQNKNTIQYSYANTGSGTGSGLEFTHKGTLHTIYDESNTSGNGAYPGWDADWLLTSDSTYTFTDDAGIVLFATGYLSARLRQYTVDTGGGLTYVREFLPQDEDSRLSTPQRQRASSVSHRICQPFVKVAHSVDSAGAPTATRDSRILIGYNASEYDSSKPDYELNPWAQLYCTNDAFGSVWGSKLYTNAGTGVSEDLSLARVGVGYDSSHFYLMAEMHANATASTAENLGELFPQRTNIVYAKFPLASSSRTEERGLWTNVSIVSDGFIPHGSTTSKCYWWFSAAQLAGYRIDTNAPASNQSSPSAVALNSIGFIADQTGFIHGHGVKGSAPINPILTNKSVSQAPEDGPSRNMQCLVSRVTDGRWVESGSSEFWCGASMADLGASFGNYAHMQPARMRWDTDPYRPMRTESAHGVLYACGGLLWSYDGNRFTENDFMLSPVILKGLTAASTAAFVADDTYSYYVTFEYQDDEGVKHVSPPGGPYTVTLGHDNYSPRIYISLSQITNHRYSTKDGNPPTYSVNVYRTNANGTVHYLHDTLKDNIWGDDFSPVDPVYYWEDTDPDDHSIFDEVMTWDSMGAQLAGNPISSPVDIARHKDSLMVANTENILYSSLGLISSQSAVFPGVVAENAGAYALYGDSFDSPITHIASNGPNFLFFTPDAVFGLDGDGPDSIGVGTWSRPVKISEGQGVRAEGFVATTPLGVLYSSHNGIYIVGRDAQVINIGAAVDDYTLNHAANDPLILDSTNEVIIPLWGGDPSDITGGVNRTALVFNYFHKQWYRMELPSSVQAGRSVEWRSWVDRNDQVVLYLVDSDGYLYKQKSPSSSLPYGDTIESSSAAPVECSAETSWIQFPEYGGKMRIYRMLMMGTYDSASSSDSTSLTLKSWTNFNGAAANETFTSAITAAGIGAEDKQGSSEVVIKPAQQKAESLRVSFVMTSGSAGKGWSPEGILFEVGRRKSATRFKVNSEKQVS